MTRVHGNAFMPQAPSPGIFNQVDGVPYTDVTGAPFGWGKAFRIKQAQGTWIHVAIPTVAQIDGSQLFLDEFFVLFTTEVRSNGSFTTQVAEVHAWDGSARFFTFRPPQPYAGDFHLPRQVTDSSGFTFGNTWRPRRSDNNQRHHLNTGLGLSLNCGALQEGNITFHSAGASFTDTPA